MSTPAHIDILSLSPAKLHKIMAKQTSRIACLGNDIYGDWDIRARPLMKWTVGGEVPHPERLQIYFVDGKGNEIDVSRPELPLGSLFGLFSGIGNYAPLYNAEMSKNAFATNETVAATDFKHAKVIGTLGPLPATAKFLEDKYPGKYKWGTQLSPFLNKLQAKVCDLIVDIVKKRAELGDKDPNKIPIPQMLIDLIPDAKDPVARLKSLNRLFYMTVKDVNKKEPDGRVKIGFTEYLTSKDFRKIPQGIVLPDALESMRDYYEEKKCIPKNINLKALSVVPPPKKRKRQSDSEDEFDEVDAEQNPQEPEKPHVKLEIVSLNPVAQSATKSVLNARQKCIEDMQLSGRGGMPVVRVSYKQSSTQGFSLLFSDTTVKFYLPSNLEILVMGTLPTDSDESSGAPQDDEVADALMESDDE